MTVGPGEPANGMHSLHPQTQHREVEMRVRTGRSLNAGQAIAVRPVTRDIGVTSHHGKNRV